MTTTSKRQGTARGSAAAILRRQNLQDDYWSYEWWILYAAFFIMSLIFFLFTPYTHQLDEIKNMFLYALTPFLLVAVLYKADFTRMRWRTHASTILLGLFTASMVVSWFFADYKLVGERTLWFQVAVITYTLVFAWYMNSENKLRKTMMYFVLISLASTIIGLFLFAGQGFTDQIYEFGRRRDWSQEWLTLMYTLAKSKEMYSTILNPDFYAAYLVMTIPITLSMFFVEDHLKFKVLAIVTFLLMNVCLVFTNSNDSYMSIILGYFVYFVLGLLFVREWNISWRTLITFFAGAAVLAITVIILMLPQLHRTWDFKADAYEGRRVLWYGGFWPWLYKDDLMRQDLSFTSIIFGTGPGGYRFYFPVFRRPDYFDNQINNVTTFSHNYYLDILLEFGLIGLLLFLAFYGRVLYDGIRQVRRTSNRTYRFYQMALVSGLIGIIIQNYLSPNNRWAVAAMIFYALFGLSMGLHHLDNPGEPRPEKEKSAVPLFAKVAAGILAALFLIRSTPQGLRYIEAARANGLGLHYMNYADATSGQTREGLLRESQLLFEKAIATNPTFATSYYKLAHVYNGLGYIDRENQAEYIDKAIATYERLNEINPHYSEIHLNLGIMYWAKATDAPPQEKLELLEKAYEEIKEAARQEWKPDVQYRAGVIGSDLAEHYQAIGREQDALELYEELKQYYTRILEYEPKLESLKTKKKDLYLPAHRELIRLAYETGDMDEVEKILKKMYREDPDNETYLNTVLAFYTQYDRPEGLRGFLEEAAHNDPMDARLRRMLAENYREIGDRDRYLRELKVAEVIDPQNTATVSALYNAYQQEGVEQKAAEYEQKLKELGVDPTTTAAAVDTTAALAPDEDATTQPPVPPAPPITHVQPLETTATDRVTSL